MLDLVIKNKINKNSIYLNSITNKDILNISNKLNYQFTEYHVKYINKLIFDCVTLHAISPTCNNFSKIITSECNKLIYYLNIKL